MKFDWSGTSDPMALQPGTYRVEITKSEEKTSKNGNPMWELVLKSLDFNCKLCHDRMMLTGNGANMTRGKLKMLGFKDGEDVEAGSLVGLRCWVTVKETPADGQYARKLDVDISAKGSTCGYWSEAPANVVSAPPPVTSDEAPW